MPQLSSKVLFVAIASILITLADSGY